MCGDHKRMTCGPALRRGSPPHVRGPLCRIVTYTKYIGITPACAGTTVPCTSTGVQRVGSPPHVRGPPLRQLLQVVQGWITPACAGTTSVMLSMKNGARDHPRMCGDHPNSRTISPLVVGSPPHVRGPPKGLDKPENNSGITPACAGTT